jgi:hypothetical protein
MVLCDFYCSDREAALVGYVPPLAADRKVALVQTGNIDFEFGVKSDHAEGWKAVGMNVDNLTFF